MTNKRQLTYRESAIRGKKDESLEWRRAIRSIGDYDIGKLEAIIKQKKAQLNNSKDDHESERLFQLLFTIVNLDG
jgi:hypothetical protein